jgi:drug/metabolite transporter (DMT)-like permease
MAVRYNSPLAGYVMTALGSSLFSTKAIFIKLAFREDADASLMLAWRMIFSTPLFVIVGLLVLQQKRRAAEPLPPPRTLWMAAFVGALGYFLSAYLDFKGLEYISAQLERLVLFTYPLFVMFLGAALFGTRITKYGLAACAITYTGLAIVFGLDLPQGGWNTVIGTALVLGCAVTFALNQLYAKKYITKIGSILFTAVSMTAGGASCLVFHGLIDGDFSANSVFLWNALGCAIFATFIPIFLVNGGLERTSAQSVAMISTLSPIVTIALAVWILGEPFTLADAVGSALVLAGVGYYTWADQRAPLTAK